MAAVAHEAHGHHDSHGNHEAHGHHEESFVSKYIFSQDHKMIGKQFLLTAVFMLMHFLMIRKQGISGPL